MARGSRADLKRAVTNLVSNALQNTPSGGRVDVRVAARDAVELTVADDGFGIDARARASLFQRFSSASRSGGGTGLGLYIVRRIAEDAAGSRPLRAARAARVGVHADAPEGCGMSAVRVAIVEDHALVRAGLRTSLEAAGIDVVAEAADGIVAAETVAPARSPTSPSSTSGFPARTASRVTRELKALHPPAAAS